MGGTCAHKNGIRGNNHLSSSRIGLCTKGQCQNQLHYTSAEACAKWCLDTDECVAFNLFKDLGGSTPGCALYKAHHKFGGYETTDGNGAYECYVNRPRPQPQPRPRPQPPPPARGLSSGQAMELC